MLQRSARGRFLEIFLFTLSSLVLYHVGNQVGIGVVVFLVPLQVVASRRGAPSLLAACGLFLLVFLALRLLPFLGGALQPDIMTIVETIFVLSLLLGLLIVNLPPLAGWRALFRLLGATAVAGLGAIPCAIWLSRSAQFQTTGDTLHGGVADDRFPALRQAGNAGPRAFRASFPRSPSLDVGDRPVTEPACPLLRPAFLLLVGRAGIRGALDVAGPAEVSFLRVSTGRLLAVAVDRRSGARLADLVLGSRSIGGESASTWQYAAWNIGFVLLILYGLQGLAILRFLFEKHGLPRLLWLILVITLAILAASPRSGAFVMVLLPGFRSVGKLDTISHCGAQGAECVIARAPSRPGPALVHS